MTVQPWHVRGLVLPEGVERDVYVVEGRISFEPVEGARTVATDLYLLPGLVDVHAHLSLASPEPDGPPEARVRASARAHLDAGVLAVREPGSVDYASIGLGPDEGLPRVTTAGRFLAPPGRYFPGLAREVLDEELPEAALHELARSGDWVKIIGDSPFPDGEMTPTFGVEAIAETVRRVHAAGGRVAIHCGLAEVVQAAVDAGVDSLEHASFLRADQAAEVAAAGIAWVPTLSIIPALVDILTGERAAELHGLPTALQAAYDAGVAVLAGTDAGMGPHGTVLHEMGLIADAGLPVEAALSGGSWAARAFLGLPGIEEGAPADLVGVRGDPRADLSALRAQVLVALDGRIVRG